MHRPAKETTYTRTAYTNTNNYSIGSIMAAMQLKLVGLAILTKRLAPF